MSTTRYAILGLLAVEPMSGYDIRANLDESVSHFWSESYGQIYPALKALAREGLATPERGGRRHRRVYAITPAGRAALRRWLKLPPRPQPPRSELLLKIFLGRHAPLAALRRHLASFADAQRTLLATLEHVEAQLHETRQNHPDLQYWVMAIEAGRAVRSANLAWARRSLAALQTIERTRP